MAQEGGLAQHRWNASEVRQLYQRHGAALVAYACSFLPDAAAAEDAVHSVFLNLLRNPVAAPVSQVGYLYRAAKNAALNQRRDSARKVELPDEETWFVHQDRDRAEILALQQALADLPEEQREVVIMRIWSGMTLEEIGLATGISLNTAASRYRYALEKLRAQLAPGSSKRDRTSS